MFKGFRECKDHLLQCTMVCWRDTEDAGGCRGVCVCGRGVMDVWGVQRCAAEYIDVLGGVEVCWGIQRMLENTEDAGRSEVCIMLGLQRLAWCMEAY